MIEIICDKCERSFAVDDAEAGGKVPCPLCGDINRVPAADRAAASAAAPNRPAPNRPASNRPAPDRAAASAAAPAVRARTRGAEPTGADGAAEREIRVVRPAMVRAHPLRFAIILVLVIGGVVGAIMSWDPQKPYLSYASLVLTLIGLVWLFKWWIAAYLWIKITITNKRTIRHEGIVRRHSTEVMHDHVRSVDINQNFVQRLCRVGYIGIDSAGQDGIEIEIRDIPDPYGIKKLIDRYRKM